VRKFMQRQACSSQTGQCNCQDFIICGAAGRAQRQAGRTADTHPRLRSRHPRASHGARLGRGQRARYNDADARRPRPLANIRRWA
jgi:hypothetical protein